MTSPWKESGAMVYVALTVATFSAVTMCCVWAAKRRRTQTSYMTVEEEEMELTSVASKDSGEEVILSKQEGQHPDNPPVFTFEDSDDEEKPPVREQTTPV